VAKFVSFIRSADRKPVLINPEFVAVVERYRDDPTQAVIYTTCLAKGGVDSRNYVVVGDVNAIGEMLR
jgi:hypothetical protein